MIRGKGLSFPFADMSFTYSIDWCVCVNDRERQKEREREKIKIKMSGTLRTHGLTITVGEGMGWPSTALKSL